MGQVVSLGDRLKVVRTADQVALAEVREADDRWRGKIRAAVAKQRVKRKKRTAPWANWAAMQKFYAQAARLTRETGIPHEVDHIVPLVGDLVSGLHVETNLRVVTKAVNREKSNRFEMVGDAGVEPATFRV